MEGWFRRKSYLPKDARLIVAEILTHTPTLLEFRTQCSQTGLFSFAPRFRQVPKIRRVLGPSHTPEFQNYPIGHWGVIENKCNLLI